MCSEGQLSSCGAVELQIAFNHHADEFMGAGVSLQRSSLELMMVKHVDHNHVEFY